MDSLAPDSRSNGPRERLLVFGEPHLSDAECLAVLLRTGRAGLSAEQLAQHLLQRFGGLAQLAAADAGEIAGLKGVGPVRAASLKAAFGLARRLVQSHCLPGKRIRNSGDVARLVRESSRHDCREMFWAVHVDARHRVISVRVVSIGTMQNSLVHPREVYAPAIRESAAGLLLAHNHPSGDAEPSNEDREITQRLSAVGELVGIAVLDHVVVGADRFFSFADRRAYPIPQ